jgi:hypothetical protein
MAQSVLPNTDQLNVNYSSIKSYKWKRPVKYQIEDYVRLAQNMIVTSKAPSQLELKIPDYRMRREVAE